MVKRDLVPLDQTAQIRVVGDHAHDVHRQHARSPAKQQVLEAMVQLRHRDQHAYAPRGVFDLPGHLVVTCQHGELCAQLLDGNELRTHRGEYRAHVEAARQLVVELLGLDDGSVVIREEPGDRGHDALAVGAHQQQRESGIDAGHEHTPLIPAECSDSGANLFDAVSPGFEAGAFGAAVVERFDVMSVSATLPAGRVGSNPVLSTAQRWHS